MFTMRKALVALLAVGFFAVMGTAVEGVVVYGPSGSGGYNAYEFIYGDKSWDQARVDAYGRSFPGGDGIPADPTLFGHLVTITSQTENDFVHAAVGSGDRWIGLTDSDRTSTLDSVTMPGTEFGGTSGRAYPPAGQTPANTPGIQRGEGWAWVTGEPVVYQTWTVGEPNNYVGVEDGALMRSDGYWNDHRAGTSLGSISNYYLAHVVEWELNLPNNPIPLLGIGPPGGYGSIGIREVRNNGTLNSVADAIASLQSGTGLIFDGTGAMVNHNDPDDAGGGGYFGNASKAPFLSDISGVDDNDIAFLANGWIKIETPGMYTFGFRSDDGAQLRIPGASFSKRWGGGAAWGDMIIFPGTTGDSNTAAATYLAGGVYPIEFIYFESGGGAYAEVWAAQGDFSGWNSSFHLVGDVASGGLQLVPEPATLTLLALGVFGLASRRRRR